ncbi:MAG TPA: FAD-dependent oxidoreductase, partial [Rhodocyclaceae bacterium]|nr:FAD-dependent oxidoreductase [Rhodocyclaceae bacterium]
MNRKKIALLAAIALMVFAYFHFDLGQLLSLESLKAQRQEMLALVAQNPGQIAALYFLIYVVTTALSLPGAALLTLAGGAVFGLFWGTLIVSFASSLGATLAFLSSRYLLRDWVAARFGQRLAVIDQGIQREGALYLFSLRLIPVFPFFLVNLLFGLTAMKTRTYYWVSQLGMLAATVVFVNAGTQLARIESLAGILSPALLGSFALLGLFPLLARKVVALVRANQVYAPWQKPARFERNLVIIGGGSAGLVTAYIAAAVKAKVTLIEQHRLGGDCLNTGCVPSKALIRSARLLAQAARAREFGMTSAEVKFDFAEVMERVQRVIRTVEPHDSAERYNALGVEVLQGSAKILTPWTVRVTNPEGQHNVLSTRCIVIATGARPAVPPIPGLDEVGYLTSDTVWQLRELPRRLVVLGGGPIGCELTQAFARFGAAATQVEMAPRLLLREDAEVSELVEARFRDEGIAVLVGHLAKRFVVESGEKILIAEHQGQEVRIPFDAVLVAVGRSANLKGFGLEELGIPTGRTVATNE